jgi:hypothetical protein
LGTGADALAGVHGPLVAVLAAITWKQTMELDEVTETPSTTVDEELAAMARIVDALGSLDDAARERVMHWANDRFIPARCRN